jgi:hypothetical protein
VKLLDGDRVNPRLHHCKQRLKDPRRINQKQMAEPLRVVPAVRVGGPSQSKDATMSSSVVLEGSGSNPRLQN